MLSGETRGRGGQALARHLLSRKAGQRVQLVAARHLPADDLAGQLRQLVAGAAHGRTDRPVWHVHIDPSVGHDHPEVISVLLRHLEAEFGLGDQERGGVLHTKSGRTHAHIFCSLVQPDGRVIDLRNSYRRREKVAVITAADLDLPAPPIPKPRSVYRALVADGNAVAADWMLRNYDMDCAVRVSDLTPARRNVQDRTEVAASDLRAVLAASWPPSSPFVFRSALASAGLTLAMGKEVPVVIDRTGTAHSLARELRAACKSAGAEPPRAAAVRAALEGLRLPPVAHVRRLQEIVKNDRKHPFMKELESTHGDVLALHPLLQLLEEEGTGEDPIRVIVTLLEAILARLSRIESALSLPEQRSPAPVEL